MAGNVDTRIIQMQFDNREFEKNIAKSQNSIEDLKEAMNFEEVSRGLEKFAESTKVIGFDALASNVEKLMNKFTGLGTVTEYVLSRIRYMAESAARSIEGFVKGISLDQIPVGERKYDALNKAVMTIVSTGKASEKDAYTTMERVMTYTSQTSHSFETMVAKISELTSIGMGLDEAERLIEAMGNAATFAGQGASEAAMSMSVLSKVFSAQYLSYERFLQLSQTSKVITDQWRQQALDAGVAVGTLVKKNDKFYTNVKGQKAIEVTAQNLETTLRNRWLTSDVLKKIYENYMFGDTVEDLEKPMKAAITVLDKSKEEIGKKMQEMFPDSNVDLLRRKVLKAGDDIETVLTETFTASKDGHEGLQWNQDIVFNMTPITPDGKKLSEGELNEYVEDLLRKSVDLKDLFKNDKKENGGKGLLISADVDFSSFKEGIQTSEDLAKELHRLQEAYYGDSKKINSANTEFGRTAYLTGQRALTLTDAINAIKESVSSGWMESFRHLWGDVSEAAEHFTNICDRVVESLDKIKEFRNGILESWAGDVIKGRNSFMRLLLGDYEEDARNGVVGLLDLFDDLGRVVYKGFVDFISLFAGPKGANVELMQEKPEYFGAIIGVMLRDMTDNIQKFNQGIHDFFNDTITVDGGTKTRLEVIREVIMGVSGALKMGLDLLSGIRSFIGEIGKQLTPSFDTIINFFGKLGVEIFKTADETGRAETIKKFFQDLATVVTPVTTGINDVVTSITNLLSLILGLDKENKDRTEGFTKLGNVLLSLADIASKIIGPILEFFASIINAFTNLFSGDITPEKFEKFGKDLSDGFKTMMKSFADSLPESFGFLGNWIRDLFGLWENEADLNNRSFFTFLRKLFTGQFGSVGELITSFSHGFNLKDALESGFGFISAFNFLRQVTGYFKGTNLYGLIMAFLGVTSLITLISLITHVRKAVKTVTEFFDDVGGNLKQGFMGDYEWFGERMLNISKAIGIIVACVAVLGSMNPKAMIQGILGVIAVVGAIMGLYFVMTKLKAGYMQQTTAAALITSIALTIAAITAGLSILSLAILPLASDWKKMAAAIVGIIAMLGALGGFLILMIKGLKEVMGIKVYESSKSQWKKIAQLAIMIGLLSVAVVAISAAVSTLAVALTPLAMTGWGGMLRAIIGFAAFLTIFGGFLLIMIDKLDDLAYRIGGGSGFSGYGKMAIAIIALSASLILISVGVGILATALTPLALMSWEGLIRAIIGLGAILFELSMMIQFVTGITTKDKAATIKIAGLAAFAFSIGALIMALTPLALMSWDGLWRAIVGLGLVLVELSAFMWVVRNMHLRSVSIAGLAGFVIGIGIIMLSLQSLASMSLQGYLQALVGFAAILTELAAFMWILKTIKLDMTSLTSIIGFSVGIWLIMQSLKPLADMTPEGYARALSGFGAVLLALVVVIKILDELNVNLKTALSTMLVLISLGAAMILFSIAFNEVRDVPWQNIIAFAGGIALLVTAVSVAAVMGNAISIRGILMLSLAMAAIMGVLAIMIPVLMGAIGASMTGLASRLTIFAQLMSIFSDKMSKVDTGSVDKLKQIAGSFKDLISVLVSVKLNEGTVHNFTKAIADMTLISDQLTIFQSRIKTVKVKSIDDLKTILGRISNIFANEVTSITGYYNIASLFSTAMYNLGTGIEIFNNHTGNIGNVNENSAVQLIQALSGCAGDLDIIYKMDINRLTEQLSGLGGALMLYAAGAKESQGVTGFDPTDEKSMSGIKSAIALLQAIGTAFAEEGVTIIPDNMPSEESLGLFGAQLAALAGALVQFETAGASLGAGTDKALETLEFFQRLKDKLVATNFTANVVSTIDAFKDANGEMIQQDVIAELGRNIEQLGSSLGIFAASTTQVDQESGEIKPIDYSNATAALDSIVALGEKLPSVGGVIQAITGTRQDISDLATQVELLGSAMGDLYKQTSSYNEKTGTYTPFNFSNTIDFLNCIKSLIDNLPYIGGINLRRLITGDQMTLDQLGDQLNQLGAGLNSMSASITGEENGVPKFDADKATLAANLVSDHILPIMQTMATDLPRVGGFISILNTALHGRDTNMGDISAAMSQLGTGLAGLGRGISDGGFESVDAVENAFAALEHIFGVMTHIQELFVESNTLFGSQYYGMETFGIFKTLTELMNFMTEGISEKDSPNGLAYSPIIGSIKNFVKQINEAFGEIAGTSEKAEEIKSRLGIFKLFSEGLNALTSTDMTVDWSKIGEKMTTEIATTITNGETNVITSFKNMLTNAHTKAQNIEGLEWSSVGKNAALGVAAGFTSGGAEYVNPAAIAMMINAYNAGMAAIDAHSPSRLFMEMGGFVSQGLAIGIDKGSNAASNSTENMMLDAANIAQKFAGKIFGNDFESSVMNGAPTMMAALSTALTDNLDANPVISPVLDLTNLEAGMDQFTRDTNGRQITLNTRGITAAAAGIGGRAPSSSNEVPTISDYSGLYERIESLGAQLGDLGSAISKMKFVLDSGVIAGGVTDDIDKNLGRKTFYAGRNN